MFAYAVPDKALLGFMHGVYTIAGNNVETTDWNSISCISVSTQGGELKHCMKDSLWRGNKTT